MHCHNVFEKGKIKLKYYKKKCYKKINLQFTIKNYSKKPTTKYGIINYFFQPDTQVYSSRVSFRKLNCG